MHVAFIARQPIFDRQLKVVGYELLFGDQGWLQAAPATSAPQATATVVLNSLTELDLRQLVGTATAWVNVSREFVLDGLVQAIPAQQSGLEISGTEVLDEELSAALRALREQGYRLALDGAPSPATAELFDIVKLDVQALGDTPLREEVRRLHAIGCEVLADGVATYVDRDACLDAGCDLLQGHFFCQPSVAATRGVPANRLALLQVVAALQRPDVELSEVQQLIARDVALSFRMLRYVNSAAVGLRGEVRSIGQALTLLGLENARRWATLSVMASVGDKPAELTVTALTRARFCELAGEQDGGDRAAELFTLGLLSVLDALMDTTMSEALELLPLADDMREALVDRTGSMGELLDAVTARERGDTTGAASVPHGDELYLRAVIWADNTAESLYGAAPASDAVPVAVPDVSVTDPAAPADVPAIVIRPEGGPLRRLASALGRLFGRAG